MSLIRRKVNLKIETDIFLTKVRQDIEAMAKEYGLIVSYDDSSGYTIISIVSQQEEKHWYGKRTKKIEVIRLLCWDKFEDVPNPKTLKLKDERYLVLAEEIERYLCYKKAQFNDIKDRITKGDNLE